MYSLVQGGAASQHLHNEISMHVNCKLLPYMYICSSYINKIIVTRGNNFSDVARKSLLRLYALQIQQLRIYTATM